MALFHRLFATLLVAAAARSTSGHAFMSSPAARHWQKRVDCVWHDDGSGRTLCDDVYPDTYAGASITTPDGMNGGTPGTVMAAMAGTGTGQVFVPLPETPATSARHGLCGDPALPATSPQANLATGSIVSTYTQGSVVDFDVVVTTNHKGHFEFSLCDLATTPGGTVTQECLDSHRLERAADAAGTTSVSPRDARHPTRYYVEPACASPATPFDFGPDVASSGYSGSQRVRMRYQLPAGVTCERCVVQMYYLTANSCTPPGYGTFAWPSAGSGCGSDAWWSEPVGACDAVTNTHGTYPEEFWNCADVQITAGGAAATSVTATAATATAAVTVAAATAVGASEPTMAASSAVSPAAVSPSTTPTASAAAGSAFPYNYNMPSVTQVGVSPGTSEYAYACMDWSVGSEAMTAAATRHAESAPTSAATPHYGIGSFGSNTEHLGKCFGLTVAGVDRPVVLQVLNSGPDVHTGNFDIQQAAGGFGIHNGCVGPVDTHDGASPFPSRHPLFDSTHAAWGADTSNGGTRYGGFAAEAGCDNLPDFPSALGAADQAGRATLKDMCHRSFQHGFRVDTGANPAITAVSRTPCPDELVALTGVRRSDDDEAEVVPAGGVLTRMMDCAKPSAAWEGNVPNALASHPAAFSCKADGYTRHQVDSAPACPALAAPTTSCCSFNNGATCADAGDDGSGWCHQAAGQCTTCGGAAFVACSPTGASAAVAATAAPATAAPATTAAAKTSAAAATANSPVTTLIAAVSTLLAAATPTPTADPAGSGMCVATHGQCGGIGHAGGSACCTSTDVCQYRNPWYSQCVVPGTAAAAAATAATAATLPPNKGSIATAAATAAAATAAGGAQCPATYQQCGGSGWSASCCSATDACVRQNQWYSQCIPS